MPLSLILPPLVGGLIALVAKRLRFFKQEPGILGKPPLILTIASFVGFFAVQLGSYAFISALVSFFQLFDNHITSRGWIQLISLGLAGAYLLFITRLPITKHIWGKFSFHTILKGFLCWVIVVPWVIFLSEIGEHLLEYLNAQPVDQDPVRYLKALQFDTPLLFATALWMVTIVPMCEELLFRGLLLSSLRNYLPLWLAIGLSSLIFTLFHYSIDQGFSNLALLPPLFLLSCLLGFIYIRFHSIWSSMALHSLFNAISITMLLS